MTPPPVTVRSELQFGQDGVHELTGWTVAPSGFTWGYDGNIRVSDFQVWDADLTVTDQAAVAVRSDLHDECSGSTCELDGSGIELVGVGGTAMFTLRGKDRLTAAIARSRVRPKPSACA